MKSKLRYSIALSVLFVFSACYPLGSFQGPEVLPEGSETAGVGILWLSNVITRLDSSQPEETVFLGETSVLFRRGLPGNTEIGMKFVGLPWGVGSIKADLKWQIIREPLMISLDLGASYWGYNKDTRFVGFHPALLMGGTKGFAALQYNYLTSARLIHQTQDLILGRHFKLKDSNYVLTPLLGLHRNPENPEDIYFSLGFAFNGPLNEWSQF